MSTSASSDPSFDGEIRVPGVDRVFKPRQILTVLLVPLAMSLVAVSSVNVALTTIGIGLDATEAQLQWVLSGYALTIGITLVPAGRLGDLFGRGTLFQLGLVAFTAGSIMSGLAQDPSFLNFARVIQGIGGGLFSPQIMGIIQQTFSGQARAKAFGLFGMVVAVSVAVGPVLAGLLITVFGDQDGWRYTFFVNGPLGVLGIVLGFLWLPFARERRWLAARKARKAGEPDPNSILEDGAEGASDGAASASTPGEARKRPRRKVDLDPVGAMLLALAVLGIMYPFTSREFRWPLVAIFIGAIALLFVWWKWESYYTARGNFPMVNLDLLRIPSFSMGTIVAGAYFMGSTTTFAIVAMYLQMGLEQSAMVAGTIGLPNALISAFAARWASQRALRIGRPVVQFALAMMIVGSLTSLGVVALIAAGKASFWWLLLTLGILGIGQGAFGAANQTLSLDEVPIQHGGTAGGVKQTAERIATAIGNSIMTAIYFSLTPILGFDKAVMVAFCAIIFAQLIAFGVGHIDMRRAMRARKEGPLN
ncbi:MAG: MFS transporter [Actinomycetaceae bacterium]|nr:MFS transporter [Actinomycetaceae bacterium]